MDFAMGFLAASNLIVRALSCIIIYTISKPILVAFYGFEQLFFWVYRAVRRDLVHWLPLDGVLLGLVGFIYPIFVNILSQWTSCCQFRCPTEVGGAYWTWNLLVTALVGMIAATFYEEEYGKDAVDKTTLILIMSGSCLGIFLSFAALLFLVKKGYVHTFYDKQTATQYILDSYLREVSEEREMFKINIFSWQEAKWRAIIGDEVKAWLECRLPVWLNEQPVWFDDYQKSLIPEW